MIESSNIFRKMDHSQERRVEQDLDEINITRFRQIVKPENSLLIALNDLLNQAKYRFRQMHVFDYKIPFCIILASAIALFVVLFHRGQTEWANQAEKAAAILGVTTSVLTYLYGSHTDRHYRKMTRASDYVRAWTSEPIQAAHR